MGAANRLLRFRDVEAILFFDEVRVAHADVGIIIVEQDFGLRPFNHLAVRRVDFAASHEPGRIAVIIRAAALLAIRAELADEASAVVVEPVEVTAVAA